MSLHPIRPRLVKFSAFAAGTGLVAAAAIGAADRGAPATVTPSPASGQGTIVALGDSIAFGANPNLSPVRPSDFRSFADQIGADKGWKVVNFAQPGETTASLLDNQARNNGGWISDPVTGARVHDRPLHQPYSGSQRDAAVDYLKQHPQTRLVTLTIGGNDLLLLQDDAEHGRLPTAAGELLGLPDTAEDLYENSKAALEAIRAVYSGPIVVTNNYSTDYSKPINAIGLKAEGLALARAVKAVNLPGEPARIADLYGAFEKATAAAPSAHGDPGAAGLLIPYQGGYDKHPSTRGSDLIAKTVEAADPLFPTS